MIISWGGMGKYKERWEVGYKCEDWQVIYGRGGRKTRGRWGRERRFEHWWWGEGAEKVGNGIVNAFSTCFCKTFTLPDLSSMRERERDSLPLSLWDFSTAILSDSEFWWDRKISAWIGSSWTEKVQVKILPLRQSYHVRRGKQATVLYCTWRHVSKPHLWPCIAQKSWRRTDQLHSNKLCTTPLQCHQKILHFTAIMQFWKHFQCSQTPPWIYHTVSQSMREMRALLLLLPFCLLRCSPTHRSTQMANLTQQKPREGAKAPQTPMPSPLIYSCNHFVAGSAPPLLNDWWPPPSAQRCTILAKHY